MRDEKDREKEAESLQPEDYSVGWICAVPHELTAARAMLDSIHAPLKAQPKPDENNYTLGSIGKHNIAITCLPEYGVVSAAVAAKSMQNTFLQLRFGLMVGIGGGIPSDDNDIRLGDIAVSLPTGEHGGVIQYDLGKMEVDGFRRLGTLNKPPTLLRTAIATLRSALGVGKEISGLVNRTFKDDEDADEEWTYLVTAKDVLFNATFNHVEKSPDCVPCLKNTAEIVERETRKSTNPRIFYGNIASGNSVMKNALERNSLAKRDNVICFEMEAAGLMDNFPCLVIRGICDYADSHKNKKWQPYAAAVAAAYAKKLLSFVSPEAVSSLDPIRKQDQLLEKLPYADGAAFNSQVWEQEPRCLPDTRVDLLQQIKKWARDPCGACIFWLSGIAGTGKSTIARTVSCELAQQKSLAASFLFSRGRGDLGHAARFFTTIAVQLAEMIPAVKPSICNAIAKQSKIGQQGLSEQWKHLIFQPLSSLSGVSLQSQTFVLVVDALDECEGEDHVRLILKLLAEVEALHTVRFRIFLTSRPETSIRLGFRKMSKIIHWDLMLHSIPQSIIEQDISVFLRHELKSIKEDKFLEEDWPGIEKVQKLIEKADRLFIYAATVCRFLRESRFPDNRLLEILQVNTASHSSMKELDKMYTLILDHLIINGHDEDNKDMTRLFKQIVGSIIILFDALSTTNLTKLLAMSSTEMDGTLQHLHSVLDIPQNETSPIQLFHPSFRDFLLNKERCKDAQFWINEEMAHNILVDSCLKVMSNILRRDICRLQAPGTLAEEVENYQLEQNLPLELQYACLYWVQHFQKSGLHLRDDGLVYMFLQKHFLHWLEALSLMRKTSEGIIAMTSLESIIDAAGSPCLYKFLHDAKRFILYSRSTIEVAPLQIYYSALIFAPEKSRVRVQFKDQIPEWIYIRPKVQNWSLVLQTLEGHSSWVTSVAFSPDGSKLASASDDRTVRLWNVGTGQVEQTLEGHSGSVTSVAFSPDGSKLASASYDQTVRLWNIGTGQVEQTLEGHSDWVTSVAFSPDGSKLASASDDRTVRLWNIGTGQVEQTLEGHSGSVTSVAFSPDGSKLASASGDRTVRLWNVGTGQVEQTLEGHSGSVTSMAFSPDGSKLASASGDRTVRLWNVGTGQVEQTLEGHSDSVKNMAFWVGSVAFSLKSHSIYRVDNSKCWVTRNSSRILHLPWDYRPGDVATQGCTLAIGAATGRVMIITLPSDVRA